MKWYHFQEGGPVPQYQSRAAANKRKSYVDEVTDTLQSDIDATAWALTNQGKRLGTRIDNLNTGYEDRFGGLEGQLGGYQDQIGGLQDQFGGLQENYTGLQDQYGGLRDQFGGFQDQIAGLQDQFGGFQNQAAIDRALAVDQARRKALSERIPGRVPPPRNPPAQPGPNTPNVQTGIPQGGYARPAWDTYLAGTDPYQIDFSQYSGTGAVPGEYGDYTPAPIPVPEVTEVPVETKDSNPASNTPIDLTGSSDDALPTGAVGVVGDPTEIGNNPVYEPCLLYTSPSPRDRQKSRMPSSA